MRNGNLEQNKKLLESNKSSYPTYEEWKQFPFLPSRIAGIGSYPTYEEWKPLKYGAKIKKIYSTVLILPMRNGNYFKINI